MLRNFIRDGDQSRDNHTFVYDLFLPINECTVADKYQLALLVSMEFGWHVIGESDCWAASWVRLHTSCEMNSRAVCSRETS